MAAVGLAACAGVPVSAAGVREVAFDGISGGVRFYPETGSRPGASAYYVIENVMIGKDGPFLRRVGAWTEQGGWVDSSDFIFNGGSSVPPDDGLVASCPAGTYLFKDRECLACPAGTFQPTDENVGDEGSSAPARDSHLGRRERSILQTPGASSATRTRGPTRARRRARGAP